MLHRCVFTPTYASANTLAAGCAHMCIGIYVCICMHMHMTAYVRLWYCLTRWGIFAKIFCLCIRVHIHAYVYVCACKRVWVHVYMYVYVYMYVCVYVCIYICIRARVGVHMHSCRCILFICTVQSLYYMRVYHRCFWTLACVCVGELDVEFVSACSWIALVTGVGGYVLAGVERDRGFVLYISLFLRVLGRCVCVCLYTCLHTHKLLGYLMWAQVWDEHLESQKNPDRLKRIIYVDRIGVHSFEESRRCDNNQQITVSHFGAH